ncbi:transferrin-binding protein-like solute binding protein [Neisseria shayeganii]|uniref:Transferrin-binding protein B C-lobe/N-lobe beta-barrel domain-containing protein n=1 Tax=Neisseria shayeganii TaxID=607712 RepID=A0A7D7S5B2_9NEIS|nr:transferrin-binding protein-like solute binding protein [Neisseria shayeganii]QMT40726.1 hypothetical protein H3L94_01295 [Neisseria shayeganii]
MNLLSKKSILAIACALALGACGSSGSSSNLSVQPEAPKPQAPQQPQEPTPKPQEPAPKPQEPAPKPQEPAPKPQEPAPKPQEPAPKPQEPAPKPQEPAPKPQEPAPKPQEPAPKPQEPAPKPQEPAPKPQEPAPKPQEPNPGAGQTFGQVLGQTFVQGGAGAKGPEWMVRTHNGNDQHNGALISIQNDTGIVNGGRSAANQDFESFMIDGKQILLLGRARDKNSGGITLRRIGAEDFPNGGFNPKDTNNPGWMGSIGRSASYGEFSAIRYGVYTDANNVSHLFVHGKPASYMRGSGRYEYTGSAVHGKDGVYSGLRNAVTAVVDFDNKTVDVSIALPKQGELTIDPLKFGGSISGNTFSGKQNGVETRGGFFGYDDMGGVYNVLDGAHKGYNGVFGTTEGKRLP